MFITHVERFAVALAIVGCTAFGQASSQSVLSTNKPRPVMELVRQLEGQYGWRIAYEEAPYEYPPDLVNVASAAYVAAHPGASFLVPRPQQLSATVPNGAPVFAAAATTATAGLIQTAINSVMTQASANGGGAFTVSFNGDFAYVVPTQHRKKDGSVEPFQPILDTPVTLTSAERTIRESINLIRTQVASVRGVPINEGTIPTNLYHEMQTTSVPANEPARVVLSRIFGVFRVLSGQLGMQERQCTGQKCAVEWQGGGGLQMPVGRCAIWGLALQLPPFAYLRCLL